MKLAILAVVITVCWSSACYAQITALPENNINCENVKKADNGNWVLKSAQTFKIGASTVGLPAGQEIVPRLASLDNYYDLHGAIKFKCGGK
jgi:hypothetical protein